MVKIRHLSSSRVILLGSTLLLSACAAQGMDSGQGSGFGSGRSNNEVRVLVMGEDSDPTSVSRRSDAFVRVLAEMKDSMSRHGFRMVDEEFVAAELGWRITNRRPKTELVEAMKLANASGKAHLSSRAMALFRIHASRQELRFANQVRVRVDGELYDGLTNQFLGAFEVPSQSFPAPANCSSACLTETVGDYAREIAISVGDVLGTKLSHLHQGSSSVANSDTSRSGLVTTYTLSFRKLSTPEIGEILGVMADEFPGYISHNLLKREAAVANYEYVTTAPAAKMDQWINILLNDLNLTPDKIVSVSLRGTEFRLEKLVSPVEEYRPPFRSRFN